MCVLDCLARRPPPPSPAPLLAYLGSFGAPGEQLLHPPSPNNF